MKTIVLTLGIALGLAGTAGAQLPSYAITGYNVTKFAGSTTKTPGSADGTGTNAKFRFPQGIAMDAQGNLYIADADNNLIRKITPGGAVATLAGSTTAGTGNGTGTSAQFNSPRGLAIDAAGNVYVADANNHVIRKITPQGVVTTFAGKESQPGSADGSGANARFNKPKGMAIDGAGNLFVADEDNHTIRKITPKGVVTTLAGTAGMPGYANHAGKQARFSKPSGIAIDASGKLYIADAGNNAIRIINGTAVSFFAGNSIPGFIDGTGLESKFNNPTGITIDNAGNLYIADQGNNVIRKISTGRIVSTIAGKGPGDPGNQDGVGTAARFQQPIDIVTKDGNNIYVVDNANQCIRLLSRVKPPTTKKI